jgi:hypothetical protein
VRAGIHLLYLRDITFESWKEKLQSQFPGRTLDPFFVWRELPERLRQEFRDLDSTLGNETQRRIASQNLVEMTEKWVNLEWSRLDRWDSPDSRNLAIPTTDFPAGLPGNEAAKKLTTVGRSTWLKSSKRPQGKKSEANEIGGFTENHPVLTRYLVLSVGAALCSWLLSPLGWFSVFVFVATLLGLVYIYCRRGKSAKLIAATFFMFVFIAIGIVHDIFDDDHPSAECSDGWYSHSAHRSGTCSSHGGVAIWQPTLHHWWQTLLGD